ncbi:MAG: dephospho-CoA kinase [Desulfovibrio sp.]|jgi:23S rRNA pseudouridine1911/1915/1917 synthase|nr:dephospho-CoA kinase [Desulfovibrio sp.]
MDPNAVAKPFRASRLALGRGPNPSQASAPERNPALQGGVGAISGLAAGVSDHKGSSDDGKPLIARGESAPEEIHVFSAGREDSGSRLDAFLAGRLRARGLSRERIKDCILAGGVTVDGLPETSPKRRLAAGSEVRAVAPAIRAGPTPEEGALAIVYRDAELAVINKPAGMVTHPASGLASGTLVHRLMAHFPELSAQGGFRPGIVHRLDKDTSGLMLAALTERSRLALAAMFARHEIYKEYLALVRGVPARAGGVINAPVGRHPARRTKMAVSARGRAAKSSWRTLYADPRGRFALLAVRIHSGRTHQVRVHMQHLGHPLWGDALYGGGETLSDALFGGKSSPAETASDREPAGGAPARQMLHAWKLGFVHPFPGAIAGADDAPGERPGACRGDAATVLTGGAGDETPLCRAFRRRAQEGYLFFRCPPPEDFGAALRFLSRECLRVAVTGLPGCGKSSLLEAWRRMGVAVFSADAEVRRLYERGGDGRRLLRAWFGDRFVPGPDDPVDKAALGLAMRDDPALRREIEGLIHPLVRHALRMFWREQDARGASLAAAEIPLYLEADFAGTARRPFSPSGAGARGRFSEEAVRRDTPPAVPDAAHVLVGVYCPASARWERLERNRGWSGETAACMDAWQWPEEKKMAACDSIVDNSGPEGDMPGRAEEAAAALLALRAAREEGLMARFGELWGAEGAAEPAAEGATPDL